MADLSRRDFLKKTAMTTVGVSAMLAGSGAMAFAEEEKKELKVRAAVFSPTGGTMNAAYLLASMLAEQPEMIDQTSQKSRENEITFAQDELAIFAAPSYAGSIPHAPGLFENLKGNNTPCIIVTAFGNRAAENNFAQTHAIASRNGFVVIGAIQMVTPHIFGARAGHSRPDIADHAVIRAFAESIKAKLSAGNLTAIAVEGSADLGTKYESTIEKKWNAEVCVGCGLCASECPTGAIAVSMEINAEACIHCQRCSHVCPVGARSYASAWDGVDSKYLAPRKSVTYIV